MGDYVSHLILSETNITSMINSKNYTQQPQHRMKLSN